MLHLPDAPPIYRILSIDPGSDTLGIAMIDVDLQHFTATLTHANTIYAGKAIRHHDFVVETFGERQARLNHHAANLRRYLYSAYPHCVVSEAPYMGRFPQAFETLVECLYMLRGVVAEYDPSLCMETIDAPTAKKVVGAPGKRPKGMDKNDYKETVRTGILGLGKLRLAPGVDIWRYDEHAIDAIAVGCYKVRCIADTII